MRSAVTPCRPLHTPAIAISICICLHMGKHHRAANRRHKKPATCTSCLCWLGTCIVGPLLGQTDRQADSRTPKPAKQTKTGSVATTNMRGLRRRALTWVWLWLSASSWARAWVWVLGIGCHLHVDTRSLSDQELCYRNNSEIMFK